MTQHENGRLEKEGKACGWGHMLDMPPTMTYASVVSWETVQAALTLAALNDLEVKTSDVKNAFLFAPCKEKMWTMLGPEFGPDEGKRAVIVQAFYTASKVQDRATHDTWLIAYNTLDISHARPTWTSGSSPVQDQTMGTSTMPMCCSILTIALCSITMTNKSSLRLTNISQ